MSCRGVCCRRFPKPEKCAINHTNPSQIILILGFSEAQGGALTGEPPSPRYGRDRQIRSTETGGTRTVASSLVVQYVLLNIVYFSHLFTPRKET